MYQGEGSVSMAAPRPWDLRGDTENSQSSLSKQRLSGAEGEGTQTWHNQVKSLTTLTV